MNAGRDPVSEQESPYWTRACCPDCGAAIDARTALCEDWRNPLRKLGCPECGLWLVRNERKRVRWVPLCGWSAAIALFSAAAKSLARDHLPLSWMLLVDQMAMFGSLYLIIVVLANRYVRRIGPPLSPPA
jgi:hypothetical protein